MSLSAVFFDVGNTLLRERPARHAIYAEAARARGLAVEPDAMRRLMLDVHGELPREVGGAFRYGVPWFTEFIRRIFHGRLGLPEERLGELADELFARFAAPETFELAADALELLDELRARGLRLGVISNWSPALPELLAALGVAGRVDFVLCSALERAEKPDPALFEHALRLAGVPADRALHVGDHLENDVLGAQRAGLRAILFDPEGRAPAGHPPRVGSLAQLRSALEPLLP